MTHATPLPPRAGHGWLPLTTGFWVFTFIVFGGGTMLMEPWPPPAWMWIWLTATAAGGFALSLPLLWLARTQAGGRPGRTGAGPFWRWWWSRFSSRRWITCCWPPS